MSAAGIALGSIMNDELSHGILISCDSFFDCIFFRSGKLFNKNLSKINKNILTNNLPSGILWLQRTADERNAKR